MKIIEYIRERHAYWFEQVKRHVPTAADTLVMPRCEFEAKRCGIAGKAWRKRCVYNLSYAVTGLEAYDETIAHEVMHSVADQLFNGRAGHSSLWHWLMCSIGHKPNDSKGSHRYGLPTPEAHELAKFILLTLNET